MADYFQTYRLSIPWCILYEIFIQSYGMQENSKGCFLEHSVCVYLL